jgi:hypothetical protein
MLEPKNIFAQSITLYEFVALWALDLNVDLTNLASRRKINHHHSSLVEYCLPKPPDVFERQKRLEERYDTVRRSNGIGIISPPSSDEEKHQSFIESLTEQLFWDEKLNDFPERENIEPTYTHHYFEKTTNTVNENDEFSIEFFSYKLTKLIDWVLTYSIPPKEIPEWVLEYKNPIEVPDGHVLIRSLPKLLQLVIQAHLNFDWKTVDHTSTRGKQDFKKSAEKFLKDNAISMKIPHSDNNKRQEIGLSNTTIATFLLAIKPDEE